MVQNIISAIFAIILIVFTALFIRDPCLCFGVLCKVPNWDSISTVLNDGSLRYTCTSKTYDKLPVLKAMLAFAIVMLVSNLIFILAYIISFISSRRASPKPIARTEIYAYESPPKTAPYDEYQPQILMPKSSDIRYYDPMDENARSSSQIRSVRF